MVESQNLISTLLQLGLKELQAKMSPQCKLVQKIQLEIITENQSITLVSPKGRFRVYFFHPFIWVIRRMQILSRVSAGCIDFHVVEKVQLPQFLWLSIIVVRNIIMEFGFIISFNLLLSLITFIHSISKDGMLLSYLKTTKYFVNRP